jgi:hypothetical protein
MTTSEQEDQTEKRRVVLQDADVRRQQHEQAQRQQFGTFFSHAQAAANDTAGGRFASVSPTSIVGSEPTVKYPAASPSWQIQLPDEPPLSAYENPALEDPTGALPVSAPVATDDPAHVPPGGSLVQQPSGGLMFERAGSSPSSKGSSDDGAA